MIFIVSPGGCRERGGIGRVVDNTVRILRQQHPEVGLRVLDSYGPGRFGTMPVYFLWALLSFAWHAALDRITLAHVHMAEYGSVLRKGGFLMLARAFGVPVVLHLHGAEFADQIANAGALQLWALGFVLRLPAELLVLGEFWRTTLTNAFGHRLARITVLENAVPGPERVAERAARPQVGILFLGRLTPVKNVEVLLDSLASPRCRDLPWLATIAGDGDLDRYREQADRLGIADRVRFTGWLSPEACREELDRADILVQPSRFEGLPMAILEAMAHGLAIVATPVGSVPEAIEHRLTGLLVPVDNRRELADALAELILDPVRRRRLGREARRRFEDRYDLTAYGRRLLAVYRRNARRWFREPDVLAKSGTPCRARRERGTG